MVRDGRTAEDIRRSLEAQGLDASALGPLGVRPPLHRYLAELWGRRHFILADSRYRVASINSRNRLGNLWLLLRPMLDASMYFVIFGLILHVTRGVDNFGAYVVIGVLVFRATANSIATSTTLIRSGRAMIRAFSFPRASLVFAAEAREAIQMLYSMAAMLVLIMLVPPFESPRLTWFLVIPLLALQICLDLGISFILARLGSMLPDIAQAMRVITQFLMYGSGILFPIDRYLDHPGLSEVIRLNPVYQLVHMHRQVLMDGTVPPASSWGILAGWALGLLVLGFIAFWHGEASYGAER